MTDCYAYIRVSTVKQGEGASLEAQRDAIIGYAKRHQLTITQWFEEQQTAAKKGRPVFTKMVGNLKRGQAGGLLIHKIDRSARNFADWAAIHELADRGVGIYVAADDLDFTSRGGRLSADIQAVIAADYIRNLREECIKGLKGRLNQGLYPFRAPIGYHDNGKGKPKTPDPVKAPLIRDAFRLYASGRHSLRSLQAEMARRGLRNHNERPVTLTGIETILNNPFYTGLIVIKRTGAVYQGIHKPLITNSIFKRVQDVKSDRSCPRVTRHDHLYQGLFRCGLCHRPMSPEKQKGHVYYRCQNRSCATKTIREDVLEKFIAERLTGLQLTKAAAKRLHAWWQNADVEQSLNAKKRTLTMQRDAIQSKLDRLTDLLIEGTLDVENFNQRKRVLTEDLREANEAMQILQKSRTSEADLLKFIELTKSLAQLHKLANRDEKRRIVSYAFSNRDVVEKSVELKPCDWLQAVQPGSGVTYGGQLRYIDRTLKTLAD